MIHYLKKWYKPIYAQKPVEQETLLKIEYFKTKKMYVQNVHTQNFLGLIRLLTLFPHSV